MSIIDKIKGFYKTETTVQLGKKVALTILLPIFVVLLSIMLVLEYKKPSIQESSQVVLSSMDVKLCMQSNGVIYAETLLLDPFYTLASEKWVYNTVSYEYEKFLETLKMVRYMPGENDCDDYARAFTLFAKVQFRKDVKSTNSIACGEFIYEVDKKSGHAINYIIVLDSDRKVKVLFYEPQKKMFVPMLREQIEKCIFYGS